MSDNITTETVEQFQYCEQNNVGEKIRCDGHEVWCAHSDYARADAEDVLDAIEFLDGRKDVSVDLGAVEIGTAGGVHANGGHVLEFSAGNNRRLTDVIALTNLIEEAQQQAE